MNWCKVYHVVTALHGDLELCLPGVEATKQLCQHCLALDAIKWQHRLGGCRTAAQYGVHQEVTTASNILTV